MKHLRLASALLIAATQVLAFGQTKGAIKQAIEAKYPPAQANDERNDLTAAGAVIDLLKDDLVLATTGSISTDTDGNPIHAIEPTSIYKNGKFQRSGFVKFMSGISSHNFVAGEKCWLIGVDIKDDGAVLEFLSDPISGTRYRGFVKYPFLKGQIPAADAVLQQVAETIAAEPIQSAPGTQGASVPSAAPTKMAAIPPPPQPTDAPVVAAKSISLGQTKAQVTATFGPPNKVVTLPTKEIDYFADMKVIFVKGKVVDVQ
jgi:hypothetical protein